MENERCSTRREVVIQKVGWDTYPSVFDLPDAVAGIALRFIASLQEMASESFR